MTAEPKSSQGLLEFSVELYRKTFKRIRVFHRASHWLFKTVVFPALEQIQGFRTMSDDPFWFRLELLTGRHEPETASQLKQLIQPNMTVLDIGAHVGYYTRMASNLVGDKGRVIAFEPNPTNHAMLKHNVGDRKNVTLMQVALAEAEGTAELYDYLMMSASGSLHYDETLREVQLSTTSRDVDFAPRLEDNFEPRKYTVRTAPVDDLMRELNITQIDVVKMDIEGAEMGALRGMREIIIQSPNLALVMEYNPLGLKAFDNNPTDALQEVLDMGFSSLYVIEADGSLTDYTHRMTDLNHLTDQLMHNMSVVNLLLKR
ncbi:MAG: FkbM family methyltransferase [Chloroflexota bacterium]